MEVKSYRTPDTNIVFHIHKVLIILHIIIWVKVQIYSFVISLSYCILNPPFPLNCQCFDEDYPFQNNVLLD
jgi:hypothetical protein